MATDGLAQVIAQCAVLENESMESDARMRALLARYYGERDIDVILPTIREFCNACAPGALPRLLQMVGFIQEMQDAFLMRICARILRVRGRKNNQQDDDLATLMDNLTI